MNNFPLFMFFSNVAITPDFVLYHDARVINPYSAGIDFGRQNLTSVDVFLVRL